MTTIVGARALALAGRVRPPVLSAGIAAWLLLQSLAQRPNHDESQYVAGAVLALDAMPFRDFLLLQPPLHAWAFAPVAWLWPTDSFVAMRMATAALALATILAVIGAQRAIAVPKRIAVFTALLMASTASFQFTAGIVRNDMLATCLASLGLWALLSTVRLSTLLSGLAFGLAAATKLSFIPLLIAAGLHLTMAARERWAMPGGFVVGAAAGLSPALLAFLAAPQNFTWGVFTFASTAPFDWYGSIGRGDELTSSEKLADLLGHLAVGPGLGALLLVAFQAMRARAATTAAGRLMGLMILAGVAGAALPTPTHKQYLMPLLPPLFVSLGLVFERCRPILAWSRMPLLVLALVGLGPSLFGVARAASRGLPALGIDARADEIGDRLRALGGAGPIATLAPDRAADSGFALDPRFATGPFVFRSGRLLDRALASELEVVTPQSLASILDAAPPGAILVGYEFRWSVHGHPLDAHLEDYAQRRRWRRIDLGEDARLYVRPHRHIAKSAASPPLAAAVGYAGRPG